MGARHRTLGRRSKARYVGLATSSNAQNQTMFQDPEKPCTHLEAKGSLPRADGWFQ